MNNIATVYQVGNICYFEYNLEALAFSETMYHLNPEGWYPKMSTSNKNPCLPPKFNKNNFNELIIDIWKFCLKRLYEIKEKKGEIPYYRFIENYSFNPVFDYGY